MKASACVTIVLGAALPIVGCHTPPLPSIDESVAAFVHRPMDIAPQIDAESRVSLAPHEPTANDSAPIPQPAPAGARSAPLGFEPPADRSAEAGEDRIALAKANAHVKMYDRNVLPASYVQPDPIPPGRPVPPNARFKLRVPSEIPGGESPLVSVPSEEPKRADAVAKLFPELPALPAEPKPVPGPGGKPFALADLQRMAAANSPLLRQAASDVEAARGQMIQDGLYPNPTVGYSTNPNANNTGSATWGFFFDQVIKTGGKLKLQVAQDYVNMMSAELALKKARYALATVIRSDYYTLLVARETVRVNRALVQLTDEIFRVQADLLKGGFAGAHEPAALRSQAYIVRLAYKQSVANYVFAWKELVADMGFKQLPFTEVEGSVDRLIPSYDYDTVLAFVLANHTDILTARNSIEAARYGLKLAKVTPVPDIELQAGLFKENMVAPFQNYHQIGVSIPLPVWNRNQGGILSAASALVRAAENPHQTEIALTANLAATYANYKVNLAAIEYYRRNILPDQVQYYRGVFERRKVDPSVAFGDLVQAQQVLVAEVTSYLGVLNTLWTSVVGVADFLQTDDLFQLAKPLELPHLPAPETWACPHANDLVTSGPAPLGVPPQAPPAQDSADPHRGPSESPALADLARRPPPTASHPPARGSLEPDNSSRDAAPRPEPDATNPTSPAPAARLPRTSALFPGAAKNAVITSGRSAT